MSDKKTLERQARAIWDAVRKERRERRKLLSSADLTASAERLKQLAEGLSALAAQAHQIGAPDAEAAAEEAASPVKPKNKAKDGAAKVAKKTKKKPAD